MPSPRQIDLGRFEKIRPYLRLLGIRQRNIIRLLFPTVRSHGFVWTTRGISDTFLAWGTHEDFLEKYLLQKGDVFLDIGAHVGRWAVCATEFFDLVLAFEPSPRTSAVLRRNIGLNHLSNIRVLQVAVGNEDGESRLYVYNARGHDSLLGSHPVVDENPRDRVLVPARRLDTVMTIHGVRLTSRSCVKVDTEGYELNVLAGARNTILQAHPRLLVEVHGKENIARVIELLVEYGYAKPVSIIQGGATYVYAE